jgi:hypothetical protein
MWCFLSSARISENDNNLKEREEMHKFVAEHLKRGTI